MSFKIVGIGGVLWDMLPAGRQPGLLAGWELDRTNDHANRVAAFVCSSADATPTLPDQLRSLFAGAVSRN